MKLEKIRFVAANYTNLKGLKMAVIGFLVLGAALWSNDRQGDMLLPMLMLLLAVILLIALERYYRQVFGQVRAEKQIRLREA